VYLAKSEQSTAIAVLAEMLRKAKATAMLTTGALMRVGTVALPTELPLGTDPDSLSLMVQEALHKIEGSLMDRSGSAIPLTNKGNLCHHRVRPGGWPEREDEDIVVTIQYSADRFHVSVATIDRHGLLMNGDSRRIVPSADPELSSAIRGLVAAEKGAIKGAVVAGNMMDAQFRQVMNSLNVATPGLAEKVKIPLGSPEVVSAVGAACYAWDLAEFPNEYYSYPWEIGQWNVAYDEL
jgi:hypothetical protein